MLLPKPLRKFVAIFRGEVSPVLILLSVALGLWFGLTPGWYGIHVILLVLALVLNTHVGIFLMFAGLGKALCYAAAPVLFYVGEWAQGELAPVLDFFATVPVLGLSDFARYSVAGALVIGPLLGLACGLTLARSVSTFRRAWLTLEDSSDAFRKWQTNRWVRWLDWLLLGKQTKDVGVALKRRPKVIRLAGVGIAVAVLIASAVGLRFVQGERLTGLVAEALTKANGAQVDLARFNLAVLSGRVTAGGVQVTDPEDPSRNRIAVSELTADASVWDLLRGKLVMDDVVLAGVEFDQPRAGAGLVLAPPRKTAPPEFEPTRYDLPELDVHQLQSYFESAEQIDECLQRLDGWLAESEQEPPAPAVPQHYLGYLTARAPLPPTPRVLIRQAALDDVQVPLEQAGRSTITCTNLNDAPAAAGLPVTVTLQSRERPTELRVVFHYERGDGGVEISGSVGDIDLRELQTDLSRRNPIVFEAGTAMVSFSGAASGGMVDIAVQVETQGMRAGSTGAGLFGLDPQITSEAVRLLDNLKTNLRLVGPIAAPRLVFDAPSLTAEFKNALVRAGKDELARRVGDVLPDEVPKPDELLKDPLGAAGGALGDLLDKGSKKDESDEDKKQDEEKEKKKDDPLSRLKERLKKP